ncbi:unknown protein [Seminavis robusta]|uniref:Uncharacterized protein n=1 Tax=Seminavis robusta TaxID=568900 RepID=A0A9N8EFM2_9STRA|nr:unknown protein [Seminavis robusta]|eukprot:Sro1114_g242790.1 n/a (234) ;mRNA; f:19783-20786
MKNFDIRENTMKEEGTERTSNGEIVVAPPNRRQQDDEKPSFGRYTFSKILSQLCFRHSNHTCTSSCDERIRQVATQAILYSLVYLNTFIWPIVSGALGNKPFTGYTTSEIMTEFVSPAYFAFHVFFWISYPLQGFLDFFVYTRVKVQEWKRVDSTVSTFYIYRLVLFGVPLPETKQPPIDLDGFNPNACRPEMDGTSSTNGTEDCACKGSREGHAWFVSCRLTIFSWPDIEQL